jgi:hypothetical protein
VTKNPNLLKPWFLQWLAMAVLGAALMPLVLWATERVFTLHDVGAWGRFWRINLFRLPIFLPISYALYRWSVVHFVLQGKDQDVQEPCQPTDPTDGASRRR